MKAHPAAEKYPLMTDSELAPMVADMKANGFDPRFPVLRLKGKTVDGRNRERAAQLAGVKPIYEDLPDDADAEAVAERANDNRRHESQETRQKRRAERIERVAEQRRQGASIPAIAENEGVSTTQVQRDIKAGSTLTGVKVEPESGKSTGKDGKERPASKKKDRCPACERVMRVGKKAKKNCPECKALNPPKKKADPEPEADTEAAWVDAWDIPITKEAAPAFKDQPKFDELLKLLRQAQRLFKELAESPGGAFLQQPFISKNTRDGFVHNGLATCILNVVDCRPKYTVCPYSVGEGKHGKDCNLCRGLGWIGEVSKANGPPQKLIDKAKKAHGVA